MARAFGEFLAAGGVIGLGGGALLEKAHSDIIIDGSGRFLAGIRKRHGIGCLSMMWGSTAGSIGKIAGQ
jgi:hypothetical protein